MNAELLKAESRVNQEVDELEKAALLTTWRGLRVYSLTGNDCPHMMQRIGRLRERVFKKAGAGRGMDADLDDFDFGSSCYHQLVVWDPECHEIVGLYRYRHAGITQRLGVQVLRTSGLFNYSDYMRAEVLPKGIELGRSVVNEQATKKRLGFFALWQGLAALLSYYPGTRYFFGNITLYRTIPEQAARHLVRHLEAWYEPPQPMLQAKSRVHYKVSDDIKAGPAPESPRERIAHLRQLLEPFGQRVPSILQSYMRLGESISMGETVYDADFGQALEIGIIVDTQQIEGDIKFLFLSRSQE